MNFAYISTAREDADRKAEDLGRAMAVHGGGNSLLQVTAPAGTPGRGQALLAPSVTIARRTLVPRRA